MSEILDFPAPTRKPVDPRVVKDLEEMVDHFRLRSFELELQSKKYAAKVCRLLELIEQLR